MFDVKFGKSTPTKSPRLSDLVEHVIGSLELLNGDDPQGTQTLINQDVEMLSISDGKVPNMNQSSSEASAVVAKNQIDKSPGQVESGDEDGRKRALRVAKTGRVFE